jgi:predicted AAA+ superfamily ATPase
VGDELAFQRFLRGAAARTGQLLNVADLARDADVAPNTARSWLSILQASGLKTPKLYFLDTGLCAYLTQWSSPETLEAGAMSGAILETWAVAEILKSYWHQGRLAPFHFYRDKDQREIDLVIEADGVLYPVEIKKTASPGRDALRGMGALERLGVPVGEGAMICLVSDAIPLNRSVQAVPIGWL